ncbi:TSG6 protein, partial [Drymodes brunneopygia]|nr:TSG6 protein [Drymodes brunneopygia]
MIALLFLSALLWDQAAAWGFKDGVLHNSIWLVSIRLMTPSSLSSRETLLDKSSPGLMRSMPHSPSAAGFHVCAAGWMAKGRVGYPIVKAGANCGFGKTGIVDYGIRLNRSERWDAYCYNPNGKECGGVFTDSRHVFKSPGYPNEYENDQICYWHIRLRYGQRIHLQFLEFDVEDDTACLADFLEVYDSYDDINGFVGRFCGDELPDDIISTGNLFAL